MIIHGDSLEELKNLEADSIDLVCTDPPYGYLFMGKDWDRAVPSVELWQECLRVLKPGAFCMVMSAPRSDVQMHMVQNLTMAGFRLDFTPIYWTYASGFPKAGNVGKLVDKRLGVEREVVGKGKYANRQPNGLQGATVTGFKDSIGKNYGENGDVTASATPAAKALDGSYTGFQPKPAVEVIIVAMKPLSEKTYVDQALKNGKGITWLDDCRVPTGDVEPNLRFNKGNWGAAGTKDVAWTKKAGQRLDPDPAGRFPANLLVSDDVLNDGVSRKSSGVYNNQSEAHNNMYGTAANTNDNMYADSGSYSRYFDLDKWYESAGVSESGSDPKGSTSSQPLPFLIVPKASKREKDAGVGDTTAVKSYTKNRRCKLCGRQQVSGSPCKCPTPEWEIIERESIRKNNHPTVKPLKLMSYLITLGSRPGDTVLDPFLGSGTTIIAAEQLGRKGIGIEREQEYVEIAQARLDHERAKVKQQELL